jgi:DNA-directed RNA polymerase specialized sigma24 family protein
MSRLSKMIDRAGLTDKEADAFRLYDPGVCGYRSVALALGISKSSAEDRIQRAFRKLAALEEDL